MDVNTFYKCKIIEILIEQGLWSRDNMCTHETMMTTATTKKKTQRKNNGDVGDSKNINHGIYTILQYI